MYSKNATIVQRVNGLFVFEGTQPIADYEHLGTIKGKSGFSKGFSTDKHKTILTATERAKLSYPEAEATIFHYSETKGDKVELIKYK